MASKVFRRVAGLNPGYSVFDLSYEKKLTCDFGQLIPIMCDEVVPGDRFTIGNEVVIRFQPLVAPILHEINCYVHYFFVPYRLLWDKWEDFITGGVKGDFEADLPLWIPGNVDESVSKNSLWDYFGFPIIDDIRTSDIGQFPLDFPRRAYNFIWNEYYRDQNLQRQYRYKEDQVTGVDIDKFRMNGEGDSGSILFRNWEKDYFTSSLPWQQRGTAPALPITGVIPVDWNLPALPGGVNIPLGQTVPVTGAFNDYYNNPGDAVVRGNATAGSHVAKLNRNQNAGLEQYSSIDLGEATTFNVADLRLAFQIQKWLERNARGGARYTEFLKAHFGVYPRDERLQRPEYIGGSKSPIIISEVLQTSRTDQGQSPQGNLAGHGITADRTFCGKYRATEYGLIMGIMSIMPRSAYQQGIDRQWLRKTKYDFYFREFANLSEQAIETREIYVTNNKDQNMKILGYQGRYDEMRVKRNMVVSEMRDTFNYWHLGRVFSGPPLLNESFISLQNSLPSLKRVFAVQNRPGIIVNFGNLIKAVRPMPIQAEPGLIDHN